MFHWTKNIGFRVTVHQRSQYIDFNSKRHREHYIHIINGIIRFVQKVLAAGIYLYRLCDVQSVVVVLKDRPFRLSKFSFCCYWRISSIYWRYFSTVMVSRGFKTLWWIRLVVHHQTMIITDFGAKSILENVVVLRCGPITELNIVGCHMSQCGLETDSFCCVKLEQKAVRNDNFIYYG